MKPVILLAICPLILLTAANYSVAQTGNPTPAFNPAALIGFWAFKDDTGDTFYLIIKKAGRVSSFWSGAVSNKIDKGEWVTDGNRIVITWPNGYHDVFERKGDDYFKEAYLPGVPLEGKSESTLRAKRVSRNLVGNLTTDTPHITNESDTYVQIDTAVSTPTRSEFIGFWEVEISRDNIFYLFLKRGGSAEMALPSKREMTIEEGTWMENNGEAIILMNQKIEGKISSTSEGYTYEAADKEGSFGTDSDNTALVKRMGSEKAKDYFTFGKPKLASGESFLGFWEVGDIDAYRYFLQIESWGKASRIKFKLNEGIIKVPGRWTLIKDGLQINFNDGYKDTLRITTTRIEKATFTPDNTITGIPLSISDAKKVPESVMHEWVVTMREQNALLQQDQNIE